uniref:Uncharacterized protein n=1 Tax=Arundo donax TaxID=35708 RepID=A0A0A9CDH0_ARUDO
MARRRWLGSSPGLSSVPTPSSQPSNQPSSPRLALVPAPVTSSAARGRDRRRKSTAMWRGCTR